MGAVSQIIRPIEIGVQNVVQQTSDALTGALQPIEKAVNKGVTDVGKTIADNPALEGAITAIGAYYGVPPSITAGFLAANKTSQTGGNLEKGLETLVLSYGAGKLMNPGAIDLSSPTAIDQSVAQAQAAAPAAAPAPAPISDLGGNLTQVPQSAVSTATPIANVGAAASPVPASNIVGTSLGDLAATAPAGAAVPAAGVSANQAVAAGMSPGALGATGAAGLTAEQLAAAAGTTGAGSALYDLATAGNAGALTDALSSGSSGLTGLLSGAGNAIGNTLGNLSGTQLAALGTGAAGLYNASATRQAMQDALAAQQGFTNASTGTVTDLYNKSLGYNAPYQALGTKAAGEISNEMPYLTHQFDVTDLYKGLAPNYDFMLQQGQQANLRAANVGGGMLGGNAQTGLNKFTQDYAGNAYQNAFTNYQNQRNNIYSNLANIAGIGQTANTAMGTAGTTLGNNIVGLNTNLSNATAANILGQAQVGAGGVTNAANTAFLATLLGQNTPTAGTATTPGSTSGFSLGDIAKLGSLGTGLGNAYAGIKSLFG